MRPTYQGDGLNKRIIAVLMQRLHDVAPAEAYVSPIADGDARRLYARYGFAPVPPH